MREVLRVIAAVALIALLGADVGLHATSMLACANVDYRQYDGWGGRISEASPDPGGSSVAGSGSNKIKSYAWCSYAVHKQQGIDEWIIGLFLGLKATDILLAIFTFMLVGVGRRQANISDRQRELMSGQLAAATTAANAASGQAETARKALYGLERPYVFVYVDGFSRVLPYLKFNYRFFNHGRAPAIVVACEISTADIGRSESATAFEEARGDALGLSEPWNRYMHEVNEIVGSIIPAGETSPSRAQSIFYGLMFHDGPEQRVRMFLAGGRRLFFRGRISYTGPLDGPTHVTEFTYRIVEQGGTFRVEEYGGKEHNYRS